jgi:hypothetical protein
MMFLILALLPFARASVFSHFSTIDGLDLGQAIWSSPRENPLFEIPVVGDLRDVRLAFLFRCIWSRLAFAEHIRQFVLAVVIHKRFHADALDEPLGV